MNIAILGESPAKCCIAAKMGQQTQLDLRVIRSQQQPAGAGKKAWRICRPCSLRTAIFCKLGSLDDSRPVAAHGLIERGVDPVGRRVD